MEKFICSVCGKEYDNAYDRANCEIVCCTKLKEVEKQKKKEAEERERQVYVKRYDDLLQQLGDLCDEYAKKYPSGASLAKKSTPTERMLWPYGFFF